MIWDSLKRKKASRRKNDLKERAILEVIAESRSKTDKSPKKKKQRVLGCKQSPKKAKVKKVVNRDTKNHQKVSHESDHDSSSFEDKQPTTKRRKTLHRKAKESKKSSNSTKIVSRIKKDSNNSDSYSDSDSDSVSNYSKDNKSYNKSFNKSFNNSRTDISTSQKPYMEIIATTNQFTEDAEYSLRDIIAESRQIFWKSKGYGSQE